MEPEQCHARAQRTTRHPFTSYHREGLPVLTPLMFASRSSTHEAPALSIQTERVKLCTIVWVSCATDRPAVTVKRIVRTETVLSGALQSPCDSARGMVLQRDAHDTVTRVNVRAPAQAPTA